jgi:ubiquinone/menaquinone biosynthesis C-methylase UbiE
VDRLLELAGPMRKARVLDLGTGPGDIPVRMARARGGWRITAVDASAPMLAFARQAAREARVAGRITWLRADAKRTGLAARRFDVVCSNSILHHITEVDAFWREVKRLAKCGAMILFRDLARPRDAAAARRIVDRYARCGPELMQRDYYNSLLAAYTVAEVRTQLGKAGLKGIRVGMVTDRHWDAWGSVTDVGT